jgi:hypothetical protein
MGLLKVLSNDEWQAHLAEVDRLASAADTEQELKTMVESFLGDITQQVQSLTWQPVDRGTQATEELDAEQRSALLNIVRNYFLKDPLCHQAVKLTTYYTFGEGMRYSSNDRSVQRELDEFWLDEDNQLELTSYAAQEKKSDDLQVDGEIFFLLYKSPGARVKVRSLPPEEITAIIGDEEDHRRALYYQRTYRPMRWNFREGKLLPAGETRTVYYADWHNYDPTGALEGVPSLQEGVVFHVAVNNLGWQRRGNTELYAALDWVKAHRQMLQDWVTIVKAYTTLAWRAKVKGDDTRDVQRVREKLQTLFPQFSTSPGYKAGMPLTPAGVAGVAVENDDVTMQPIKTSGMTTDPGDSRQVRLQVASATGIMDHYFGDAGHANLATAEAMELPMLKKFGARQRLWESIYLRVLTYVAITAADANRLGLDVEDELDSRGRVTSRRIVAADDDPQQINVQCPPILKGNVQSIGQGVANMVDGGFLSPKEGARYALRALDVPNVEELISTMFGGVEGADTARDPLAEQKLAADTQLQVQKQQAKAQMDLAKEQNRHDLAKTTATQSHQRSIARIAAKAPPRDGGVSPDQVPGRPPNPSDQLPGTAVGG